MVQSIPNDIDISCPFQKVGDGSLICSVASLDHRDSTNRIYREQCLKCPAGKVYRELGCDKVTAQTSFLELYVFAGGRKVINGQNVQLFCSLTKRETTFDQCCDCSLRESSFSASLTQKTLDFFESTGFENSKADLEKARNRLNLGDWSGSITASTSSLESTLKTILDKRGKPYPTDKSITGLWKATREEVDLGKESSETFKQIIGSITGLMSSLGSKRNKLSDAHGRGEISAVLYESYAELTLNLSGSLSIFLIKRLKESE